MKFIQIVTGEYTTGIPGTDKRQMNHAVYGLSEKGNVFKYKRNKGWVQLKDKKTLSKTKTSQQSSVDDNYVAWDQDIPF